MEVSKAYSRTVSVTWRWAQCLALLALWAGAPFNSVQAQVETVRVLKDDSGMRLQVDGQDFMVNGMNWDYFPRGTNYAYSLWTQPDDIIKAALDREMSLLQSMGVNAIRQYVGVTPKWVEYIWKNYGIYTVLNHSLGRYGVTIDGVFIQSTDYSDPRVQEQLVGEVRDMVEQFKDTPGVLMWLLGNENNYGLVWSSAETEALPAGERDEARARWLYRTFGLAVDAIHGMDKARPVAMANGDLQYIDLIAEEAPNLDIFGTNVYRGISFGDAFSRVKDVLGTPIMYTEFGADAFNARDMKEDQFNQARFLLNQWKEIYAEAAGMGRTGNSIGGLTFQWTDGWWKVGQESNLDVQDNTAGWPNDAYGYDYVEGQNNMNEEWWGIVAKGPTDSRQQFELYPRAAFYTLQQVHEYDPYGSEASLASLEAYFSTIKPANDVLKARGDKAALESDASKMVRVTGLGMDLETFSTGGTSISTPDVANPTSTSRPSRLGFDHMQSYYAKIEANPAGNATGSVTVNYVGNVADNPIDELFYENRARSRRLVNEDGSISESTIDRVKVYNASIKWETPDFTIDGFYRTQHYHWGYEGDFFGLYPEASYGPNIDTYNGEAPLGMELTGKRRFDGLNLAFGPELWWGANPAVLVKYGRKVGPVTATAIYQEDLDEQAPAVSSFAVPRPPSRKATLHLEAQKGPLGIEVGGIWSGQPRVGETFQIADGEPGNYTMLQDQIKDSDTFGGKLKLTYQKGRYNWYAQGAAMGLVAEGGYTQIIDYTGWRLKDSGSGNQFNFLTGLAVTAGNWQIAPNFLWQKPIEGPVPSGVPSPGRPRNILDDPFAVRLNREQVSGELLLTFDPTPATWMYAWDSDLREDAALAFNAGFVYRHHKTTQDAAIGILGDGRTIFAFPGAPKAQDLWEAHARIVSKPRPGFGFIANLYGGKGEANGSDPRVIKRWGGDLRVVKGHMKLTSLVKVNDWGPYDYHRDFNLTYPLQLAGDVSTVLGSPSWWDVPQTRFGVRVTWRALNQYSPRFCPTTAPNRAGVLECVSDVPGFDNGSEWEIRTYLSVNVGTQP